MTVCNNEIIYALFTTKNSKTTTAYTVDNLEELQYDYIIICPRIEYTEIKAFLPENSKFIFDDEIENNDIKVKLDQIDPIRKGWYKQQLLKSTFWINENRSVVIIDGDSAVSKRILMEVRLPNLLHTTREVNEGYELFLKRCNLPIPYRSTVCNFGFFPNNITIKNLYQKIEKEFFINYSENKGTYGTDFSEYMIISSLKIKLDISNDYKSLKIFRRGDLLFEDKDFYDSYKKLSHMIEGYDILAYEKNHNKNIIKKLIAKIFHLSGISW